MSGIRKSCDAGCARVRATKFMRELAGKPFDRNLLDRFAERVRGRVRSVIFCVQSRADRPVSA